MTTDDKLRILLLEDDPGDISLLANTLELQGVTGEILPVAERGPFEAALAGPLDLILSDIVVHDFNGMTALALARERRPELPFIFVSGAIGEDELIDLLTHGASDYVMKSRIKRLGAAVHRAVAEARERSRQRQAEADLQRSEATLRATFEHAAVGMAQISSDARWLQVNTRLGQMLGAEPAALIGQPVMDRVDPEDRPTLHRLWRSLQDSRQEQGLGETELRLSPSGGPQPRTEWVHMVIWTGPAGTQAGQTASATFVDISARKAAQAALHETARRLQMANQIGRTGLFDWDIATGRVHWSAEIAALWGQPAVDVEAPMGHWHRLIHPEDRERYTRQTREALNSGSFDAEWRVVWPDGTLHWLAGRAMVEKDDAGEPQRMLGVHIDITDRKELEEQVRRAAQRDALTGLDNRALLYEAAGDLLPLMRRAGQMAAFLFVDLDQFKAINDRHGHDVGDRVLQEVARRLKGSVREADLLGRVGGDEFVVVLSQIHSEPDATRVTQHILEQISQPYRIEGTHDGATADDPGALELKLSPSIGISIYPTDAGSVEKLVKLADQAMYAVKQEGKNHFRYYRSGMAAPTQP